MGKKTKTLRHRRKKSLKKLTIFSKNFSKEDFPPLDTIVSLDKRVIILRGVEDSILQWLQAVGIFLATSFIVIGLVDNKHKRKWYAVGFFSLSILMLTVVFFQFLDFRHQLKKFNIKVPLRLDILLFVVLMTTFLLVLITLDHITSDITSKDKSL